MPPQIHAQIWDVQNRLAEFNLSVEILQEAVQAGHLGFISCTEFDRADCQRHYCLGLYSPPPARDTRPYWLEVGRRSKFLPHIQQRIEDEYPRGNW